MYSKTLNNPLSISSSTQQAYAGGCYSSLAKCELNICVELTILDLSYLIYTIILFSEG